MKSTAIVICNYNKSSYIVNCIQSVLESNTDDYDIYVVDNASSDDSVENIRKHFPNQVNLLVNSENLGGSGGFNTGIRYAMKQDYKYIWCLDNDTLVDEKALSNLKTFMDQHPDTGMAGSRIFNMENPDIIQQNGLFVDFENYCIDSPFYGHPANEVIPEIFYSDAVAACSVLIRCSVIKEIGLMPEKNFLYWDDIEWGYCCNRAGYKVASCANSQVLHAMGAKKEEFNTFATYYAWRNWILFFIKYTAKDKLEEMTNCFLHSIFNIEYEGLFRHEKNRARTVMYAYDDVLHLNLGKASPNKYFDMDYDECKLRSLVIGKKNITIEVNDFTFFAEKLASKITALNPTAQITFEAHTAAQPRFRQTASSVVFTICDYIFNLDDLSLTNIYIDTDRNILLTEEDAYMVLNYNYSWELFLFAQQPLFLERTKKIRKIYNLS